MKIETMDIVLGEKGASQSWQEEFDKTVNCDNCGAIARLAFTALEAGENWQERAYVCHLREDTDKIWPHDCCAFAIYLCPECGEATTLWNQA